MVRALARALTDKTHILVAESLQFEQNLVEGMYNDEEQMVYNFEEAGEKIYIFFLQQRTTSNVARKFLFLNRFEIARPPIPHQDLRIVNHKLDNPALILNLFLFHFEQFPNK